LRQHDELCVPHAPFSDHVVGHVPHSTHSTFQHGNLKTAFRVEMAKL
jgi:hypothetical protein